jgi:hypothetical protein
MAALPARVNEPLEIDGSVDQRDELAAVAVEMYQQLQKLRNDYNFVMGLMRSSMMAVGENKRVCGEYEFRFSPATEYWCAEHKTPPVYCRLRHRGGDGTVPVIQVVCEPELRVYER